MYTFSVSFQEGGISACSLASTTQVG